MNVYIDANTGELLQQFSEFVSEVGKGTGTYGDVKKVSAKVGVGRVRHRRCPAAD